jgi:transposase
MKTPKPYHLRTPHDQEIVRRRVVQQLSRGTPLAHLARAHGVSRQTLYAWRDADAADPRQGLVRKPKGRQSRLTPEQLARLRSLLLEGALKQGFPTDLWTLERVRQLVRRVFGVAYASRSLWYVLRTTLHFSPQKPERRAREADPEKIAAWKRTFARKGKKGAGGGQNPCVRG